MFAQQCIHIANKYISEDNDEVLLHEETTHMFREIVGSLMYLVTCTHPDLAVAVNQLAQCMSKPCESHFVAAKCVLRYHRGTETSLSTTTRPAGMSTSTAMPLGRKIPSLDGP